MIDINGISVPRSDSEYTAQDGLLHCKKCGGQLETIIDVANIGKRKVRCICPCMAAERDAQAEKEKQEERECKRRICFQGSRLMSCTFKTSDETEQMKIGQNYVNNFGEFKRQGKGLLLYGPVGTGKSHLAACIANALIDKGYKVLMTNFATMVNILQSSFDGKQEYIDSLNRYSLLVIDDLGVERKTEYMQEQVFNIIDSRDRSGLPMIITTNLTAEELKKPSDIGNTRIYDRILEKCHPVEISGKSMRRQVLKAEYNQTEAMLKGGTK